MDNGADDCVAVVGLGFTFPETTEHFHPCPACHHPVRAAIVTLDDEGLTVNVSHRDGADQCRLALAPLKVGHAILATLMR